MIWMLLFVAQKRPKRKNKRFEFECFSKVPFLKILFKDSNWNKYFFLQDEEVNAKKAKCFTSAAFVRSYFASQSLFVFLK